MKKTTTLLALALTMTFATAALAGNEYGWTISNSSTDPFSNTSAAPNGFVTYYLWFQCSTTEGMAAAEFALAPSGSMTLVATTPVNGYINAGSNTELLLAVGGCPTGPVVACNLPVIDNGGQLCIVPAALNGNQVTVDCQATPTAFDLNFIGFSSMGGRPSCDFTGFCPSIAVEDDSWGSIKGMYR